VVHVVESSEHWEHAPNSPEVDIQDVWVRFATNQWLAVFFLGIHLNRWTLSVSGETVTPLREHGGSPFDSVPERRSGVTS